VLEGEAEHAPIGDRDVADGDDAGESDDRARRAEDRDDKE
jgi:hypothetical protein